MPDGTNRQMDRHQTDTCTLPVEAASLSKLAKILHSEKYFMGGHGVLKFIKLQNILVKF